MPLRLPQAPDLAKLRRLLSLIGAGTTIPARVGEAMGARSKYAARHAGYYRDAAQILGLVEARRWALTARGRALVLTPAGSDDEANILREAIREAHELGAFVDAVLGIAEPDLDALLEYARAELPDRSANTLNQRVRGILVWRQWVGPRQARPSSGKRVLKAVEPAERPTDDTRDVGPSQWPDEMRLPFNWPRRDKSVSSVVMRDLLSSETALIVAGFASLKRICEFVSVPEFTGVKQLRVVFGAEPFEGRSVRRPAVAASLAQEVADYWLEQGFSIRHTSDVLATITAIQSGRVQSRVSDTSERLHAKMYVSESTVTIGSSNFTEPGMANQLEANVRLTATDEDATRYAQARRLAEVYWKLGRAYDAELVELLERLLRKVSWREALARACAELLEGEWARPHIQDELGHREQLWPTQLQGIGQALYILMEVGSVLFADATGSGKTRTGAWLLRALRERLVATGRPIADPVIVGPPSVTESWADELDAAELRVEMFSHGSLSSSRAGNRNRVVRAVETARILALDEAHNFINSSRRTALVNTNFADHVLLFTATPINRDASDLLGIVNLLGADNLDDETLRILEEAGGRRGRALTDQERAQLRRAASAFIVRRTKRMLNARIDLEPARFRNKLGKMCRYPTDTPKYYDLGESAQDRSRAQDITNLARRLRGVLWLRNPIHLPVHFTGDVVWEPRSYVNWRLRSAAALARHSVRARLRSSRAALWEHLYGTATAGKKFQIRGLDKEPSGDVVAQLKQLLVGLPAAHDTRLALPPWLVHPDLFRDACAEELSVYDGIAALVDGLSDKREREKARHLAGLLRQHELVIAFDSHPITLHLLRGLLTRDKKLQVFLATGASRSEQRSVQRAFELGASTHGAIALCSNAMAEGINLQQASAMVHLDMPSVVRIAEQRVGRIDRMDSPHDQIESWWPRDAPEFALLADERLSARLELVGDLLGANVSLPVEPAEPDEVVQPEVVIRELHQQEELQLDLLDDAFSPVRAFVEGPKSLIDPDTYGALRHSAAKVLAAVAAVRAGQPWGFFAVRGSQRNAPRWTFVDGATGKVTAALDEVAASLRARLQQGEDVDLDDNAAQIMNGLLDQLENGAGLLLPRRKQRALVQMKHVLERYEHHAQRQSQAERLRIVRELRERVSDLAVDHEDLVDAWLGTIRPRWRELLTSAPKRRKKRLRRLEGLTLDLERTPLSDDVLVQLRAKVRLAVPVAERIVSAIIGVPG